MYITEESSANSKLKDFISNVPDSEQKQIKNVLNGVYLYMKHQGLTYEEVSKPQKSPYHGAFTKISGSKDLDQLTWKLKVTVPLSYGGAGNYRSVSLFTENLKKEIKDIARKENGSYFYDYTNKDSYEAVGFNKDTIVEVGRSSDGSGTFYDHNNNIAKVMLIMKVVVSRVVEDKSKIDTSDNHKMIMSKVNSFTEPNDLKEVKKALDSIYDVVNNLYGGVVESKRVMRKDGIEVDTRTRTYEDPEDKVFDCQGLVWKTEIKESTSYSFRVKNIVESYAVGNLTYVTLDSNSYTIGRVGRHSFVGIAHEYGSRGIEYLYFMVLRPDLNSTKPVYDNKFLSSDGKSLKNSHVSVRYDKAKKEISGADLEDMFNMPRFYTTKKQGIDVAWDNLVNAFDENTKDTDCMKIIGYDKCRSYCAMD